MGKMIPNYTDISRKGVKKMLSLVPEYHSGAMKEQDFDDTSVNLHCHISWQCQFELCFYLNTHI